MITLISLALALLWVGITGNTRLPNFFAGFLLSAAVLLFLRRKTVGPFTRLWRLVGLIFYFLWELVLANLRVAYDVVTPQFHMRPGVVGIPLDASTDAEITILANLISLTPGTLSLDVSQDRRTLYVHAMYVGDRDRFVQRTKDGFERRLLQVMR